VLDPLAESIDVRIQVLIQGLERTAAMGGMVASIPTTTGGGIDP
jgi:hypothetical protein